MPPSLKFGIDVFIASYLPSQWGRIGLVTNDAAFTAEGIRSRSALLDAGFSIQKLFSPEHGLSAKGVDGAFIPNGTDSLSKLPIVSLYGNKLAPTEEDLQDIDTVVFDIPDVGLRFYTYLWTLSYVLEACAKYSKKLLVLDRPNPLSAQVEGPMLNEETCSSFIGRWNVPLRHGCTLGELAIYFNSERNIGADLDIVRCSYWQRNQFFDSWQLPFQPTSPAIVSWQTLLAYPITAYIEATNLSDGRGTAAPFAQIGAAWFHVFDVSLVQPLAEGVQFEACTFTPNEGKFQGEVCRGIKIWVENPQINQAAKTGLLLIKAIKDQFPQDFAWKTYPTRANPSGSRHLDLLLGIHRAEELFDLAWEQFVQQLNQLLTAHDWKQKIEPYLLY